MSITAIILAAVIVGATGCLMGFFLCFASEKFKVEVDERETAITGVLPGNNCGGCGYAGCSGLAAAIVKGEAPVNACPVGGAAVGAKVGEIMGVAAEEGVRKTAFVKCAGDASSAVVDYQYAGVMDCRAMAFVPGGGPKACNYGCLGFGTCVSACPFDAIHIVNGIAKVDPDACKACSKCIAVCPRNLIELVPENAIHTVSCNSKDKGKDVMNVCKVGCIGCRLCEKSCEFDAITVTDNIPTIDYEKCNHCGKCVEKCPKKLLDYEYGRLMALAVHGRESTEE